MPEALRSYVLHEALCRAAGKRKDIEAVHVASLQELMEKADGEKSASSLSAGRAPLL